MGRKRVRASPYQRKPYESAKPGSGHGKNGDPYVALYASMTNSRAWHSLTGNQRELYRFCRSQISAKQKPCSEFPDYEPYQDDAVFYMGNALGITLGLYAARNGKISNTFYKDLRVLEERGFIDCLINRRKSRKKSIFRFTDRWKTYGQADPEAQKN